MSKTLSNAEKKLYTLIETEKAAAFLTLESCTIDTCTDDWHWCSTCEYHLESDGTCMNCS